MHVTLNEIADGVSYGVTASACENAVGPKFLRITDIQNGRVNWDTVPWCECDKKTSDAARLRKGDIVFARTGATTGKSFLINECPEETVFASYLIRVRLGEKAVPGYVSHFFQTENYWKQITKSARGVAQPGVNATTLKSIQIPLPPLAEQKRIAGILDAADALRAKRREALAQLDTLLQSTFLHMFGDPVTNPMGWEFSPFGGLISDSFRNGLSPSSKGTVADEVLTLSAITGGDFDFTARKKALFDKEPSPQQRLTTDTFLICRGNGNRKLVGTGTFPIHRVDSVCFPDTMIGVTVDSDKLAPAYLKCIWRSLHVRNQIESGARTTNGTYKVNQQLLSSIDFPVPPLGLQRRFAAIVESIEKQKSQMRTHLAELDALFASLQSRAFNGEL